MNFNNLPSKKALVQFTSHHVFLSFFFIILFNVHVFAQAPNVTYKAPIVITKGGTYSGNWESKDAKTPAVSINTDQPVTIVNSIIKSAGHLIYSASRNCNVIIRNTKGYGVTPNIDNRAKGRFFLGYAFKKVIIENNYMESTSGIYIDTYTGSSSATETVKVRYNKAKNIDGRYRNGGRAYVQFCVLNNVKKVKHIDISWNEVINLPKQSAVEDNINMHLSSGTSDSPILIHDNYIQGAYPVDITSSNYSGGGIMLADGATSSSVSAYVKAYSNHVVSTSNHGIAIAGGNNNLIYNNRVISCGYVMVGGTKVYLPSQNVGVYILNVTGCSSSVFYNNTAKNNISGWVNKSTNTDRNDYYLKHGVNCSGNNSFSNVTMQMETDEHNRWLQKVASNGKKIGVTTSTTTTASATTSTSTSSFRVEAEKYTELSDPGSYGIGINKVSNHSNGASVRLYDVGDKIRISFNVSTAGNYTIRARIRSGYYNSSSSNSSTYFNGAYGFWVNGSSTTFTGNTSTISGKDASYGGSYWGTMNSSTIALKSGTNTVDVIAKKSWMGIDYIEIVPSSSSQRIGLEELVEENNKNSSSRFIAYPNPVKDVLNIESEGLSEISTFSLYNSTGTPIVLNEEIRTFDNKSTIDIQKYNIDKGVYIIKIQSGDNIIQHKIFKD